MAGDFLRRIRRLRTPRNGQGHARPGLSSDEVERTYTRIGRPGRPPFIAGRTRYVAGSTALLVTVLAIAGWFALAADDETHGALDEFVVLVAFSPAAETSLAELSRETARLLAARLQAPWRVLDGVQAAATPRSRPAGASPDPLHDMARAARAGNIVIMRAAPAADGVGLSVALVRTADGAEIATHTAAAHVSALPALADRIAAALGSR